MQSLDQTALWICKWMVGIEEHVELYHRIDTDIKEINTIP